MSDVVLLRKLTRKSTMKFGKFNELIVQDVINLTEKKYLRWVYFNCSNIDFMEDILDEILIPEKFRLKKPDKNPEMHEELNKFIFDNLDANFVPKFLAKKKHIANKIVIGKSAKFNIEDKHNFNKSALQRLNHGH